MVFMCQQQYDVTYNDFNPTVLFVSKSKMTGKCDYHAHNDFTELTVILSGRGRYRVEGEVFDVEAGDCIVCNPGVYHQNLLIEGEEPTTQIFIGFLDYHLRGLEPNTLMSREHGCLLRPGAEARREIQRNCYNMLIENEDCRPGKYFMLKSYLVQIVMLIIRENCDAQERSHRGCHFESYGRSYAVRRILDYLNEHYNSRISLDQIARNMYLSTVYISKIFKEETGESPINYLIKIRLEKARELLEGEHSGSIRAVAEAVGYDDVYHFSKLFKKYYGVSPMNYRKVSGCG